MAGVSQGRAGMAGKCPSRHEYKQPHSEFGMGWLLGTTDLRLLRPVQGIAQVHFIPSFFHATLDKEKGALYIGAFIVTAIVNYY